MNHRLDGQAFARTDPGNDLLVDDLARVRLAWKALWSVAATVPIVELRLPSRPRAFANEAACRLAGCNGTELMGRNRRRLQHPDIDLAAVSLMRCGQALPALSPAP